jgi:predicted dehydrogenase
MSYEEGHMASYRGGVIGLGWTGLLYDLAQRTGDRDVRYDVDDVDRPLPEMDVHRRVHYYEHPGVAWVPTSYAEAILDRPEIDLISGADRDAKRLKAFSERYGIDAVYTDAVEMLRKERLDIVAIATNIKGRADLTTAAVAHGAKGILTEKPMCHTLEEADRMVKTCADAGVPLSCGAISTTHPSFARARNLVKSGEIGDVLSMEAGGPDSQHQNWSYFLDSKPAWVVGTGHQGRAESGSDEFSGQGMMATDDGLIVHFRDGAPMLRISGTSGEIVHTGLAGWRIWKDVEVERGGRRMKWPTEMPWSGPQTSTYGAIYSLADVMDCLSGKLDEPKNSGRMVAAAMEVEIALKESSARNGTRVDLPLEDRSLGLNFAWFR